MDGDHLAGVERGPMGQLLPSIPVSTVKGRVSVTVFDWIVQQGDALKRSEVIAECRHVDFEVCSVIVQVPFVCWYLQDCRRGMKDGTASWLLAVSNRQPLIEQNSPLYEDIVCQPKENRTSTFWSSSRPVDESRTRS